jgi:hypothetical protein
MIQTTAPTWQRAKITLDQRVLTCPHCGFDYLHQGAVRCYDRDEDARLTTVTTVADGKTSLQLLPSDTTRNPSDRRHGLAIAFDCEGCASYLELTLAQHKGISLLEWRFLPRDPQPGDEIEPPTFPMLRDQPAP